MTVQVREHDKVYGTLHASSRRDSRSQEAVRVIRRNTNRRHMIGDHHGRTVRRGNSGHSPDEILGTHSRIIAANTPA
jgi:hypothetical protein